MTTTIYIILHNQQNLAVLCMNLSIPKWKKASTRWKCCVCVFDSKYSSKLKEDHFWLKITIKGTQTAASSNNEGAWCFWTIKELSVEPLEDRPKNWLSSSLFKKLRRILVDFSTHVPQPESQLHPSRLLTAFQSKGVFLEDTERVQRVDGGETCGTGA
jgi:hypothetical protein